VVLAFVVRAPELQGSDRPPAVVERQNRRFEERSKPFRIPIRCKAHDLVLVGIEIEPQVKSHDRVQDADRVGSRYSVNGGKRACLGVVDRSPVSLAHPVDDEHEAFIPARGQVRRRRVGEVMVDVSDAIAGKSGKAAGDLGGERLAAQYLAVQLCGDGIERVQTFTYMMRADAVTERDFPALERIIRCGEVLPLQCSPTGCAAWFMTSAWDSRALRCRTSSGITP
jgi:hypothetical protein